MMKFLRSMDERISPVATRVSSAKVPLDKNTVQSRLAAAWARTIAQNGGKKATFAEAIGVHPDTVNNALCGNTVPELHTVLNSLLACPNALDEVLSLYGFILVHKDAAMSPDMQTLGMMSDAVTEFIHVLEDRRRSPSETCKLADLFRPLITRMTAIVDEADGIKHGGLRSVAA